MQTKFVLSKALAKGLKPLIVLNKMDRPSRQVASTEGKIFDLFCNLGADDELVIFFFFFFFLFSLLIFNNRQMEYETMYASAKEDWANTKPERGQERFLSLSPLPLFPLLTFLFSFRMAPLLEAVLDHLPPPSGDAGLHL